MRRRSRTRRVLKWVGSVAFLLWAVSLTWHITRYSAPLTVALTDGFVGLYWGGSPSVRNSRIHNMFSPPWNPEFGIGSSIPDGLTWEVYGPHVYPEDWGNMLQSGLFFTHVLGFWLPHYAHDYWETKALIIPVWTFAFPTMTLGFLFWWRDLRRFRPGQCQRCGYNLTGNVSGVCPECGEQI